jgi:hypothetical protein
VSLQEEVIMLVMTDRQTVAAGATVNNVLTGKLGEFLGGPSVVKVYQQASAVGCNTSLLIGNETFVQDQEILPFLATAPGPIIPDNFSAEGAGVQGDRVVIQLRNTTGGNIIVVTRVEVIS